MIEDMQVRNLSPQGRIWAWSAMRPPKAVRRITASLRVFQEQ
jgi:hypothetical protein